MQFTKSPQRYQYTAGTGKGKSFLFRRGQKRDPKVTTAPNCPPGNPVIEPPLKACHRGFKLNSGKRLNCAACRPRRRSAPFRRPFRGKTLQIVYSSAPKRQLVMVG